jgi:hypothetical protein
MSAASGVARWSFAASRRSRLRASQSRSYRARSESHLDRVVGRGADSKCHIPSAPQQAAGHGTRAQHE